MKRSNLAKRAMACLLSAALVVSGSGLTSLAEEVDVLDIEDGYEESFGSAETYTSNLVRSFEDNEKDVYDYREIVDVDVDADTADENVDEDVDENAETPGESLIENENFSEGDEDFDEEEEVLGVNEINVDKEIVATAIIIFKQSAEIGETLIAENDAEIPSTTNTNEEFSVVDADEAKDVVLGRIKITRAIPDGEDIYAFTQTDLQDALAEAIDAGVLDDTKDYMIDRSDLDAAEENGQTITAGKDETVYISVWLEMAELEEEEEIAEEEVQTLAAWVGNAGTKRQEMTGTGAKSNPEEEFGGSAIQWFFKADGELKSFNNQGEGKGVDTYYDELKHDRDNINDLILQSSVDGNIRTDSVFSIDWEEQSRTTPLENSKVDASEYSDGSYTIVGWGGDFWKSQRDDEKINKTRIKFVMKDSGDGTLEDALSHMTVYLVDTNGSIKAKIQWDPTDTERNSNNLPEDSKLYKTGTEDGYSVYEANFSDTDQIQGIKIAFDRTCPPETHETHHSGTLLIKDVYLWLYQKSGDKVKIDEYKDFGPFDYHDSAKIGDATYFEHYYQDPVTGTLPFLRSAYYASTAAQGAHEGYNLSNPQDGKHGSADKYSWHYWTMSTSDANVVNNKYSTADALQIKYSNTEQHTTYTRMIGEKDQTGEWLAITLGGEVNANTKFVLVKGDGTQVSLKPEDFVTSMDGTGTAVNVGTLFANNDYHTIYYHNVNKTSFRSVYVDFDGVGSNKQTGINEIASRYMYITEIYWINPALSITKSVSDEAALAGTELTYTLTVKNEGNQAISGATVTDVVPSGLKNVTAISNEGVYNEDNRTITWRLGEIGANSSQTLTFRATIAEDAANGQTYKNQAEVNYPSGERNAESSSNEVITTVIDGDKYYAEAGRQLNLTVNTDEKRALARTAAMSVAFSASTGWNRDNSKSVIIGTDGADGKELFEFAPGWNTITIQALGSTDNKDINICYVKLWGKDGIEIKTVDPDKGAHVITYDAARPTEEQINNADYKEKGYILLPQGKKAGDHWCFYDTANKTIGNINKEKIVFMVYLPEGLGADKYNGRIEVCYGTDKPETADVTCEATRKYAVDTTKAITGGKLTGSVSAVDKSTISYQSKVDETNNKGTTGKDSFKIPLISDSGKTLEIPITVYNYQVYDQIYVLDYGLSVDINPLGNERNVIAIDGDETSGHFVGMRNSEKTEGIAGQTATAPVTDYTSAGYDESNLQSEGTTRTWERSNKQGDVVGAISTQAENLTVSYKPTKFMSEIDNIYFGYQVARNDVQDNKFDYTNATPIMQAAVKLMPASVVYYEDNFSKSGTAESGADGKNGIIYKGLVVKEGHANDAHYVQSNSQDEQYGHDDIYNNDIGDSAVGSMKMTANAYETRAKFTFTGTGFDVVGRCNTSSAIITYRVLDEDNNLKKIGLVDTFYANGDLYQIPVIHEEMVQRGEYTVELVICDSNAGKTEGNSSSSVFYLDGIRIYNPLSDDKTGDYNTDEQNVTIKKVGEMVIGNGVVTEKGIIDEYGDPASDNYSLSGSTAAILDYVDGKIKALGTTRIENMTGPDQIETRSLLDYLEAGPNNEIYLGEDVVLGIVVTGKPDDSKTLQIEVKTVHLSNADKSTKPLPVQVVGKGNTLISLKEETLSSATAMYYRIPVEDTIPLNETGDKHLVLIVGAEEFEAGTYLAFSNLKSKGYTFGNPLDDNDAKAKIEIPAPAEAAKKFISFESTNNPKKGKDATFKLVVDSSLAESNPKFVAYYADDQEVSVRQVKGTSSNGTTEYAITIKAPKATGIFALQLRYKLNGTLQSEYISTSFKVK